MSVRNRKTTKMAVDPFTGKLYKAFLSRPDPVEVSVFDRLQVFVLQPVEKTPGQGLPPDFLVNLQVQPQRLTGKPAQ